MSSRCRLGSRCGRRGRSRGKLSGIVGVGDTQSAQGLREAQVPVHGGDRGARREMLRGSGQAQTRLAQGGETRVVDEGRSATGGGVDRGASPVVLGLAKSGMAG